MSAFFLPMALPALIMTFLKFTFLAAVIVRVLAALGIGLFAFFGMDLLVDWLMGLIDNLQLNVANDMLWILHMTGISTIMQWMISTYGVAFVLKSTKVSIFALK